ECIRVRALSASAVYLRNERESPQHHRRRKSFRVDRPASNAARAPGLPPARSHSRVLARFPARDKSSAVPVLPARYQASACPQFRLIELENVLPKAECPSAALAMAAPAIE